VSLNPAWSTYFFIRNRVFLLQISTAFLQTIQIPPEFQTSEQTQTPTKRTNLAAGVLRQQRRRQRQGMVVPPRATPLLRLLHPHRQQRAHLPPVAQHSPRATPATRLCPPPWWRTWSRSATPRRRTPRPCQRLVQVISISIWSPPYHFL